MQSMFLLTVIAATTVIAETSVSWQNCLLDTDTKIGS